jgi:hypothetical protein
MYKIITGQKITAQRLDAECKKKTITRPATGCAIVTQEE